MEVRRDGQAAVIALRGELDLDSSPTLEREVARVESAGVATVVVDLSQLAFMDSMGLSMIVRADQRARRERRRFALVKGPQPVQRLLSLTGVDQHLTLADTAEELLEAP